MISASEKLSAITTIPKTAIDALFEKEELCISHEAFVATCREDRDIKVDIGIGVLAIGEREDGGIVYKFTPSKHLETSVYESFNGKSPLISKLEDTVVEKILSAYKNLM